MSDFLSEAKMSQRLCLCDRGVRAQTRTKQKQKPQRIKASNLTASTQNARIPSASFSVAIASSFKA